MKLFAMLLVSFAAASAFACPNLDGTYQCEKNPEDANDSGVINVQTALHEGATVYVVTDKEDANNPSYLPADGKLYQEGEQTYTGTCAGNSFNMVVTGVDPQVGPFTLNSSYVKDSAQNLVNNGTVSFKYNGQEQTQSFNSTCTAL